VSIAVDRNVHHERTHPSQFLVLPPSPLFSNKCIDGRTFTKVPGVKISFMSTFLCLPLSFKQRLSCPRLPLFQPPFRFPSNPHIDTRHLDPLCEESPFNSSKTETGQARPRNSMPRRRLTCGTWAESHGQRYVLHIPGLLRVWRPEPDLSSRRDPARDSQYTRRWPSLRSPRRSDIEGSDHRGGLTYQADSRLNSPSPFDSWEHLRDTLPSNGGDYRYRRGSAPQPYGSLQSPHEVRQSSWAREGGGSRGSRGHYPGTSSRFANMHSRRETRRHFDADDDYRHQSRFVTAQPPRRSEYPYSNTVSPHSTSAARDPDQDPYTADRSRYEDSQGRPFDNSDVPPDPPSARYGDTGSFRSSSGRGGGYRGRDDDDDFSDDEGYPSSEDWL
jgi:hypothetical protein